MRTTPAPAPAPRGKTLYVVLAAVLWAVTVLSLSSLAVLVMILSVWAASVGESPVPFLLRAALALVVAGGALAAVYFAPGMRRLSRSARLALLGALACPVPVTAAVWAWAAAS
ncbi:hypothetical protein AB0J57_23830 [Streptomyces sp. NPDC049837]|uniref:hypothetical protein n=1 Tax=Streptomyces sp. NPDC049837 TaxID=3155277 RepID=UPI00342916AC